MFLFASSEKKSSVWEAPRPQAATVAHAPLHTPATDAAPEKAVAPKPAEIKHSVDALIKADGLLSVDKEAILGALRGRSAGELAEMRRQFQVATGRDLDSYVSGSMKTGLTGMLRGDDNLELAEAKALLTGDKIAGAAAGLAQAMAGGVTGLGTDEDKINSILEGLRDSKGNLDRAALEELRGKFRGPGGESLDAMLQRELSGSAHALSSALLAGDEGRADAVRLQEAQSGLGTDEAAIERVLSKDRYQGKKGGAELAELKLAYAAETEGSLTRDLASELSGKDAALAGALLSGDKAGADAARLRKAVAGLGTREADLWKVLEGKKPEEIQKIDSAYRAQTGESLSAMMKGELSGLDLEKGERLAEGGKLSDGFKLFYATSGVGTDEATVKKVLAGRSPAEIAKIKADFAAEAAKHGSTQTSLEKTLSGELSGRDLFDVKQMMSGDLDRTSMPLADKLRLRAERAREARELEHSGVGGWLAGKLDATGLDTAALLDQQTAALEQLAQAAAGEKDPAKLALLDKEASERAGFHRTAVEGTRANVDTITDTAANGAGMLAGAAATIATGGAAGAALGPLLSGMLAGGAAGGAQMATKAAMKGAAYGSEDLALDAAGTLASMVTGGLMKMPLGKARGLDLASIADEVSGGSLLKVAVGREIGKQGFTGGLAAGGLEGGIKNVLGNAMDARNLPAALKFLSVTTEEGMTKLGKPLMLAQTLQGGANEAASGALRGLVDKGIVGSMLSEKTWTGGSQEWDDVLARALFSMGTGALAGTVGGKALTSVDGFNPTAGRTMMYGALGNVAGSVARDLVNPDTYEGDLLENLGKNALWAGVGGAVGSYGAWKRFDKDDGYVKAQGRAKLEQLGGSAAAMPTQSFAHMESPGGALYQTATPDGTYLSSGRMTPVKPHYKSIEKMATYMNGGKPLESTDVGKLREMFGDADLEDMLRMDYDTRVAQQRWRGNVALDG